MTKKSNKMPWEGLVVRPNNIRMKFMLPWKGVVIHKDSKVSTIQLPESYEFRANVLSEDHAAETFDLEIVDSPTLEAGVWIQNVPILVLAIHGEDAERVVQENKTAKRKVAESN